MASAPLLRTGAIDEMRLAMTRVLLGEGENLFAGLDLAKLGYGRVSFIAGDAAMHVTVGKG
jgi:dihydrofolate reductase